MRLRLPVDQSMSAIEMLRQMTCGATKGVYAPSTWRHDADVIHQRANGNGAPSR